MKIVKILASVALVALIGSSGAWAQGDQPNFDFLAYAPSVPSNVDDEIKVFGFLVNNGVVPTPIPLDWDNNEYTIVFCGTLETVNNVPVVTHHYNPATVAIYCDPAMNGDYSDTSTFQDGTCILSGFFEAPDYLKRVVFGNQGPISGKITWNGGTRLGELGGNVTNWAMGGTRNSASGTIPSGYAECWEGKIDQPVVAVEEGTWSGVKGLFR